MNILFTTESANAKPLFSPPTYFSLSSEIFEIALKPCIAICKNPCVGHSTAATDKLKIG